MTIEAMTKVQTTSQAPAIELEDDVIAALTNLFEEKIVFNKLLGLKVHELSARRFVARLAMRPDLVGNFSEGRLHGGVISAAIDTTGGLAATAALCLRHKGERFEQHEARFARLGTIDLRVDYLRPGISDSFEIRAEVIRLGSRIANTRMEFFDHGGKLLATGNGVYIVS